MEPDKPLDRRIQRTRQLLLDSLVELILERGYEAIGIHDITERANVGRSTFYAHFESKEQLLFSGHDWMATDLFAGDSESGEQTLGINLNRLFQHAADNHRLAKAMLGKKSGELIINHLQELVFTAISQALHKGHIGYDRPAKRLMSQGAASLLVGLLRHWLEADMLLSPEKAAALARQMVVGSLTAI